MKIKSTKSPVRGNGSGLNNQNEKQPMNDKPKNRKSKGSDTTVVETRGPSRGKSNLPIPVEVQAEAASAHNRINVPMNVNNWRALPPQHQETMTWFHQHLLNEEISWKQIETLVPKGNKRGEFYDRTTIYRVLNGIYEGSDDNVCGAIEDYRKLWNERRQIKKSTFVRNPVSDLIWGALDYALVANGITKITGESGQGKTVSAFGWMDIELNNHGKSVYVEAPVFGGNKGALRKICQATGHNQNQSIPQMIDAISRAFNPNRILIIDEAARLLPSDNRTHPKILDYLREIHDNTGCALALITTARFDDTLRDNHYMFEQVLGRIDMPVKLPKILDDHVWLPLVEQYIEHPSRRLKELCHEIANRPLGGRMRRLDKLLKFSSRIAATDGFPMEESHVFRAVKILQQMMGEQQYGANHTSNHLGRK